MTGLCDIAQQWFSAVGIQGEVSGGAETTFGKEEGQQIQGFSVALLVLPVLLSGTPTPRSWRGTAKSEVVLFSLPCLSADSCPLPP